MEECGSFQKRGDAPSSSIHLNSLDLLPSYTYFFSSTSIREESAGDMMDATRTAKRTSPTSSSSWSLFHLLLLSRAALLLLIMMACCRPSPCSAAAFDVSSSASLLSSSPSSSRSIFYTTSTCTARMIHSIGARSSHCSPTATAPATRRRRRRSFSILSAAAANNNDNDNDNASASSSSLSPRECVLQGMQAFRRGRVVESLELFDQAESLSNGRLTPYLWQRGISYYYLDDFSKARRQFRNDVAVNPSDVEGTYAF